MSFFDAVPAVWSYHWHGTPFSSAPRLTNLRIQQSNKGMRQMPFTGKNLVPAKIRRDLWAPMAMVEFGPGMGDVGRSVLHKLREFKKRHELEWANRDDAETTNKLLHMTRHDRGKALNDQRANVVATVAAVLQGVGKGNKMWKVDVEKLEVKGLNLRLQKAGKSWDMVEDKSLAKKNGAEVQVDAQGRPYVDWNRIRDLKPEVQNGEQPVGETIEAFKGLHKATIYWAEERDRLWAKDWSNNVEHVVGIPKLGEEGTETALPAGVEVVQEAKEAVSAAP